MTNEQYFGLLATVVILVIAQGWYYRRAAGDVKDALTILIDGKFAVLVEKTNSLEKRLEEKIESLEKRLEDRGVIGPLPPNYPPDGDKKT